MITLDGWPAWHDELKAALKTDEIDTIRNLALRNHARVHFAACSGQRTPTVCDQIWDGLPDQAFWALPFKRHMTITWCFWHMYRIEDLIANIAVTGGKQIFDGTWAKRIGAGITDTANAQSYREAVEMSKRIDKPALKEYCITVGAATRKVIGQLALDDLRQKADPADLDRIVLEGGLTENKHSIWLRRFWGGLKVSGLLLTPLTDHHCMHLPGCQAIRESVEQDANTL